MKTIIIILTIFSITPSIIIAQYSYTNFEAFDQTLLSFLMLQDDNNFFFIDNEKLIWEAEYNLIDKDEFLTELYTGNLKEINKITDQLFTAEFELTEGIVQGVNMKAPIWMRGRLKGKIIFKLSDKTYTATVKYMSVYSSQQIFESVEPDWESVDFYAIRKGNFRKTFSKNFHYMQNQLIDLTKINQ